MRLEDVLNARAAFARWSANKERILSIAQHAFPPEHPLRKATGFALFGDVLGAFRVACDGAACSLCDLLGEAAFAQQVGCAPTELFYGGTSLRALAPDAPWDAAAACPQYGQWLGLWDLSAFSEMEWSTRAWMDAARALTSLPRIHQKLETCERRWSESWRMALLTLRGIRVDLRQIAALETALRRRGLPADISAIVLAFLVAWPQAVACGHRQKRRRIT